MIQKLLGKLYCLPGLAPWGARKQKVIWWKNSPQNRIHWQKQSPSSREWATGSKRRYI